tara:strand:+ start:33683 stop:34159 length:477 start_codon:yes stop_codon:yes gene_type:complete
MSQKQKRSYKKYPKKFFQGPNLKCPQDYPSKLSTTRKKKRLKKLPVGPGVYCSQRPRSYKRLNMGSLKQWRAAIRQARENNAARFTYNGEEYRKDGAGKRYIRSGRSSSQRKKRRASAKRYRLKLKQRKQSAPKRNLSAGRRRSRRSRRRSSRRRRYR